MDFTLRDATAADQATIRTMVRAAHLNPTRLDWPNFLVAEHVGPEGAQTVGIGQLRPHDGGVLELASLVVDEAYQGQGIGRALVHALIARAGGPLYLYCEGHNETYYQQFGFRTLTRLADVPRPIRFMPRLFRLIGPLFNWLTRQSLRLVVMAHPGP
jgi:N-acetylglutamate synthase-like GNAT family acetyltransferase